jgi:hypothetical protein
MGNLHAVQGWNICSFAGPVVDLCQSSIRPRKGDATTMKRVSFRLGTTADAFAQLYSELTWFVHLRKFSPQFPTKHEGYFSLRPVRLPVGRIGQRTITLDMMCSFVVEGQPATPDYPEFWAIRFKIVTPARKQVKVTAECCHDPVMGYFDGLLKEMGWPFPGSPRAIQTITTAWPQVIRLKRADLRQTTGPLPLDRQEIYRHLRALCDYDANFLIPKPATGPDLDELTVLDACAIRRACTAREAIIGIVRLLSAKSGIAIKLVARDAPFHREHPNRGKGLFHHFIWRVNSHFDSLTRRQVGKGVLPIGYGRTGEIVLQTRRLGRTPDPRYDEAHQRMCNGESPKDVFAWFCDEARITEPDKRARDKFKAAMKRRQTKS